MMATEIRKEKKIHPHKQLEECQWTELKNSHISRGTLDGKTWTSNICDQVSMSQYSSLIQQKILG